MNFEGGRLLCFPDALLQIVKAGSGYFIEGGTHPKLPQDKSNSEDGELLFDMRAVLVLTRLLDGLRAC